MIDSEEGLDRAIEQVNRLICRDDLSVEEESQLERLRDDIYEYELKHHPIAPASGAECLQFLMDGNGLDVTGLSEATGIPASELSAFLLGEGGLDRQHIDTLARRFRVRPTVFLDEEPS